MRLFGEPRHPAAIAAFLALLLAAGTAAPIGKSDKPRPDDQPMAMGEPPAPEQPKSTAKPAKAARATSEKAARRAPASEVVASEQRKHLERMAQINRIQAVGVETADQGLVDLARELRDKETQRHELTMARLRRVFHLDDLAEGER